MQSITHRVACKVREALGFTLTLQVTQCVHDSMTDQKLNLLLIFTFYYAFLIYRNYL